MAGGGELRRLPLSKSKRFSRSKVESKHIPDGESFRSRGSEHSSLLEESSSKEYREGAHKGRLLHFPFQVKIILNSYGIVSTEAWPNNTLIKFSNSWSIQGYIFDPLTFKDKTIRAGISAFDALYTLRCSLIFAELGSPQIMKIAHPQLCELK